MDDHTKAIKYVAQLKKKIAKKYKISVADAEDVLDEVSNYSINTEKDVFTIIKDEKILEKLYIK